MSTGHNGISALEKSSIHKITSGQVVIDLQTAVKELVENSLDAGATTIEVRFKEYGLVSVEVVDNGSGIAPEDYESVALKHHTSKLSTFEDLTTVLTFGFRGEALSSLCALSDSVTVVTATTKEAPMGTVLTLERSGKLKDQRGKIARQRGTTVTLAGLFKPLPVRRKELERNSRREFTKALNLLNAYALFPCARENKGVRLTVSNQSDGGRKSIHLQTSGVPSISASIPAIWGPKALENIVDFNLTFDVQADKHAAKRLGGASSPTKVLANGSISKFIVGCGRTGNDRQFFFINGRPCNLPKVQKAINEVYRTFNSNQSPFVAVNFSIPTGSCDVNVSPDKRTILLHHEENFTSALKAALEIHFSSSRSTFDVVASQPASQVQSRVPSRTTSQRDDVIDKSMASEIEPQQSVIQITSETTEVSNTTDGFDDSGVSARATFLPETNENEAPTSRVSEQSLPPTLDRSPSDSPVRSTTTLKRRDISPPRPNRTRTSSGGQVQKTLSTMGASWNLAIHRRPRTSQEDDQLREDPADLASPFKRRRLRNDSETTITANEPLRVEVAVASRSDVVTLGEPAEVDEPDVLVVEEMIKKQPLKREDSSVIIVAESISPVHSQHSSRHSSQKSLQPAHRLSQYSFQPSTQTQTSNVPQDVIDMDTDTEEETPTPGLSQAIGTSSPPTAVSYSNLNEFIRSGDADGRSETVKFDLEDMTKLWKKFQADDKSHNKLTRSTAAIPTDAGVDNVENDGLAADALSRVISKGDFQAMEVIGQFNLGFIIARLRKPLIPSSPSSPRRGPSEKEKLDMLDDLFIIDQHASDEKYNFETLQETTVIEAQRLLRPLVLELTAADVVVALEQAPELKRNGFEVISVGAAEEEGNEAEEGRAPKIALVAQPVSKNTVFDTKDLEELVDLLRDRPPGTRVRCSKARAMFASRACRKSVMIGMALTLGQMGNVVRQMGTIDQPWHCPHGRPTMRHLADLNSSSPAGRGKKVDWKKFV